MLSNAHLRNFTVFQDAKFDFVPGINVLVGANASGKTHLLKALYALQKEQYEYSGIAFPRFPATRLLEVFRPEDIKDLIRNGERTAVVSAEWENNPLVVKIHDTSSVTIESDSTGEPWEGVTTPVLIPVKDMLAHSVGFLSLYDQRNIDFDSTYRDILLRAFTPTLHDLKLNDKDSALSVLAKTLDATVEVQGERFYLEGKNGRFEMHMVAEGWRKIALLYQLIANGSIAPGTVLYWDEPETNLNPSVMDELIRVLLILARQGTQIFLATHNYIILKELELQKEKSDELRMFAMERNAKDGSVTPHAASSYSELKPNLIADQFERIYDLEVDRALGGANGR